MATLTTSIKFYDSVNHPKILMMDEPRQQNLDSNTYNKITDYLLLLTKNTGVQIIYTSGDKGNVKDANIALNLNIEGMLIQLCK